MFNVERFVHFINPFLLHFWRKGGEPEPDPWRVAVGQLTQAASAKGMAVQLPEGPQQVALLRSADAAINAILDDFCGTPPRLYPWPWPGPPPWAWQIVSELHFVASTLQLGPLRDEILKVAVQAATRLTVAGE